MNFGTLNEENYMKDTKAAIKSEKERANRFKRTGKKEEYEVHRTKALTKPSVKREKGRAL